MARNRLDLYDYVDQRFGVSEIEEENGKNLNNSSDPFDNTVVNPRFGDVMSSSRKDVNVAEAVREELFELGLSKIVETSSKSNETGTRRDYKLTKK